MRNRRTERLEGQRIAAVAGSVGDDLELAFAWIGRVLGRARAGGVGLVVFPECALGGYPDELTPGGPVAAPVTVAADGPELQRLCAMAGPTTVCIGFSEEAPGGPYNSAACLNGAGVLSIHRKVHLPPSEIGAYSPGQRFQAFDTPVGRLGMLICYDKIFGESASRLARDGAQVIACMSAWPVSRRNPARVVARDLQVRQFDLLDRARAMENQVVWVSANHTGRRGGLRFFGRAKVVDPNGRVLARTSGRAGMATARVDVASAIAASRGPISHLRDRRDDAYGSAINIDALAATV